MKRLRVTPERCIGCRTCELACAFSHVNDGRPGMSRVTVFETGPEVHLPVLCLQCEEAACIKVCPTAALVRNDKTGAVELTEERCVRCKMCLSACPFGNIHWDEPRQYPVKCDVCKGEPMCAMFCPTKALEYR